MVLNIRISGKLVQFLGAICANFGGIVYGLMVGWPSATMPILSSTDSPLPSGPLTKKEVSWVISIMMLGGMLGTIIFGWMANHFGRKWPLIVGMLPQVVAQSLIATAQNTSFLYTARFLSGVSGGALLVLVSIYVNEISENSIRGTLGSILGIFYGFGVIIAYIICAYMPFYSVPYVGLGILALFLLFIIFPESPQYLLLKQKDAEAEKSLKFFRGSSRGDQVKLEFESLKSSIDAASTKSNNITLQDFKPATTRKALLVSYIILSGRNLSGVFVLMNYTVDIFQQAGTGIDAHISAIIVGTIQLAGLCLTAIGIYFRLNEQGYNLSSVFWLPIASLSGIMFLGGPVQNIPVYVLSELLPTKIRGPVATVYMASVWPVTFLILQFYTPLADLLGIYGCMWIFAGWCFFEAVFAYFMLPETKGRNPEEIVKALEGKI
ncbi:facilitated trehalose transporter Tret1-2 homolog isoform X3 [Lutzomyia longipalpis]|uniref:facilitated trehalose transporter Tret1-2 homolog isoform X3 n=1 Tax=Lutzomyia longipalpis TaxID=7200 RepID=UPI002483B3D7|nr:facilitated trehalose transporter Tret1-2 homolog isoform X3 [Lutzomyia longipalpis]